MDRDAEPNPFSRRLRYYGPSDYATYWQIEQAAEVIRGFDPSSPPEDVNSVLELHNARLFIEAGFFPSNVGEDDRKAILAGAALTRRTVAQWFNTLADDNLSEMLTRVDWQYHEHLLDLLAGLGVFGRCSAGAMLPALEHARVSLADMLTSKRLVDYYDTALRERLLAEPSQAELVVSFHLEDKKKVDSFLPASFSAMDSRALMEAYIDSSEPNPNYLDLIAHAAIDSSAGIDAKLIVKARRRYDAIIKDFFNSTPGIKTGCAVAISPTQAEPVTATLNDMVIEYTFSEA